LAASVYQYKIGKNILYVFYRFVVLRWEIEWHHQKFLVENGDLRQFESKYQFNIKSFNSTKELNDNLHAFEAESKKYSGILWFVRQETKPKDILRHLRNAFAHGNFRRRQKNRSVCIVIECIHNKQIKAKGILPLEHIQGLVKAASSCRV